MLQARSVQAPIQARDVRVQGLLTAPQTVLLQSARGDPRKPARQLPVAVTPVCVKGKLALPMLLAAHELSKNELLLVQRQQCRSIIQVQVIPDPE